MHYLYEWIWAKPRSNLTNWLLLIITIPTFFLLMIANSGAAKLIYGDPLVFLWIGILTTRVAEVLPRDWIQVAVMLRIAGLFCGIIVLVLLFLAAIGSINQFAVNLGDSVAESGETINLTLTSPSNATHSILTPTTLMSIDD